MRYPALALALALSLALIPAASAYPDPAKVPRYQDSECFSKFSKRFVHDYVGMMPADFAFEMEGAACEVYATTSAHFVFVAVKDTEGEPLESYALHLFEEWGVGDAERLDGVMLLYVDDYLASGESSARIEVGYGLEGVLNSQVTEEIWTVMIDARDRALEAGEPEEYAKAFGLANGALYTFEVLLNGYTDAGFPAPEPASAGPPILFWIVVILVIVLIVAALSRSSRGSRGWGYHPTSPAWSSRGSSIWVPPSSRGGFGGGGLGGGGSFGGGRSGGGGRGGRF